MKIEEGKSYEARNGQKIANMVWREHCGDFVDQGMTANAWWHDDGTRGGVVSPDPLDLIAEWKDEPTGPVTIETVKRINTGTFKRVHVTPINDDFVSLHLQGQTFSATELRDISELAAQLADALEGK